MFDIERWQEIFDTIRKNKLRTFLTGLTVASGIFILVILLGFGQGMRNGIAEEFESDASTSVWVWAGVTIKEYMGLHPGRRIQFLNRDYKAVSEQMGQSIEHASQFANIDSATTTYGDEALVLFYRAPSIKPLYLKSQT